jgi:hypothetical protein
MLENKEYTQKFNLTRHLDLVAPHLHPLMLVEPQGMQGVDLEEQ